MLKLLLGRAGTGKTAAVLDEIRCRAISGKNSILVVPEQYSHDAERQLCAHCGNSISLHAEVLSFSGLARRAFQAAGCDEEKSLSDGGRLLVMELAFGAVSDRLSTFSSIRRKSDFLSELIKLRDELARSQLTPSMLMAAAAGGGSALENKIRDLSLILEAYPGFIPEGYFDPADSLSRLADLIEKSAVLGDAAVFMDGFSDFTAQQLRVADRILGMNKDLTVCLNADGIDGDGVLFAAARRTALQLMRMAEAHYAECKVEIRTGEEGDKASPLRHIEKNLFSDIPEIYEGKAEDNVRLIAADSIIQECEAAAAQCIAFVREEGLRWRDIAVSARGWESYGTAAESVFEKYGIPVLMNQRSGILEKPVLLMVLAALDVIENGFDYVNMFRYLKSGLSGITAEECDELENYVLRWNIRGRRLWTSSEDWVSDPEGMGLCTEENLPRLNRINEIRRRAVMPLDELASAMDAAETASDKTMALWSFLDRSGVPERLEKRAAELYSDGEIQLSDEYVQLWDILIDALEQFSGIMGNALISVDEFVQLLKLVLKSCDVGTIPAALDRVSMGEMDRMRRRDLKCLIIMGADDSRLPMRGDGSGLLSDDDRDVLCRAGLRLAEDADGRLLREMDLIYSAVALPSQKLVFTRTVGENTHPSFVIKRISELTGVMEKAANGEIYTAAPAPCFEFATTALNGGENELAKAAFSVMSSDFTYKSRIEAAERAALLHRGRLSLKRTEALYGRKATLTASRVESFYRCRYSYFMEYGLKAKPREKADFDKPELGTFVHFVLENVLKELENSGGYLDAVERCKLLTQKYVQQYTETYLGGLKGRSDRFKYLYRRLESKVAQIVADTVDELSRSEFRPLDFELDFSRGGDMPPAIIEDDDWTVSVRGKVDRADGWVHNGKLYIRVVDYKTGKKSFSLSDVLGGMGMQMLIYLFVLQRSGEERYGMPVIPAGVLYTPARDPIINSDKYDTEEKIAAERAKQLVRSGLILDNDDVIDAMEHGTAPQFIPVTFKKGVPTGDSLASLEKLGILSRHIDSMLLEMGRELNGGSITADPFYRGENENACLYCKFREACRFGEADDDKRRWMIHLKAPDAWKKMEASNGNS